MIVAGGLLLRHAALLILPFSMYCISLISKTFTAAGGKIKFSGSAWCQKSPLKKETKKDETACPESVFNLLRVSTVIIKIHSKKQ